MALEFDDRLLGEKVDNYCSSSEDEDEISNLNEDEGGDDDEATERSKAMEKKHAQMTQNVAPPPFNPNKSQTGPKGVLEDYKQFKELQHLKKLEEQQELSNLYKNLSTNCKTNAELEKIAKEDEELREMLEDIDGATEILAEYREKRLNEMRDVYLSLPFFDDVFELTSETFSSTIDNEHHLVNVIIHLYEPKLDTCDAVRGSFSCLAQEYPHVRFCNMRASDAKMSEKFITQALPALIVYKAGELIGNIIQIDKYLGRDFYADEMEIFLREHGFIPDKVTDAACKLSTVRSKPAYNAGEDFNID